MSEHDGRTKLAVASSLPIERILVGAALAPGDDAVLGAARAVALATRASLCVVHAVEPREEDWNLLLPPVGVEDVRARLEQQVRRLAAATGIAAEARVIAGPAHRVLDAEARRTAPDLLVVGATARAGRFPLGSTAARLARKASCPVLVVRGGLAVPPHAVVAPVDLSDLSANGFHCGLGVVSRLAGGSPVHARALFAIGFLDPLAHEMRQQRWSEDEMLGLARTRLRSFVAEHGPGAALAVDDEVVLGPAREEILAAVRRERADLVVMSTHGRSGFERMLLGSVAESVLRDAPCSVLLVPPTAAFGDAIAEAVLRQTAPTKMAEVT